MTTNTEIAPDLFRISTYVPEYDLQFNQFLVRDEQPLLFHTGLRALFPQVKEAVASLIDPASLRWIGFSHFEADECGALNEWLDLAPGAQAAPQQDGPVESGFQQAFHHTRRAGACLTTDDHGAGLLSVESGQRLVEPRLRYILGVHDVPLLERSRITHIQNPRGLPIDHLHRRGGIDSATQAAHPLNLHQDDQRQQHGEGTEQKRMRHDERLDGHAMIRDDNGWKLNDGSWAPAGPL